MLPMPDRSQPVDEERIGGRDLGQWRSAAGQGVVRAVSRAQDKARRLPARQFSLLVLLVTALLGLGAVTLLGAGAGEVYADVSHSEGVAGFDQPVLDAAVSLRTPGLSHWVTEFTDLGGPVIMPVIAVALTAYAVWRWRSRTPLVLVLLTAAGALATTVLGKDVIGRARPPRELAVPPYEVSASFPSGHTLNATAVLGITAYVLLVTFASVTARWIAVVAATLLAGAMGLSRVFLGHHWLTDVIAGWLLGLLWVTVVVTGHRLKITLDRRAEGDRGRSPGVTAS